MTAHIAPTFDLLNRAYAEAIGPAYGLILARLDASYPRVMKFVRWKWKAKIARLENKHFGGKRDGAHFIRHKSYRRMLYQLRSGEPAAQ
jgi:hypothetical protein